MLNLKTVQQSSLLKPLKFFTLLEMRMFIKRLSPCVNIILFRVMARNSIVKFPL